MKFRKYNNFDTLAEDKETWNQLLQKSASHVPFLTYEYQQAWWQTRGGGEWPTTSELVLVTATRADELVGIAPLFHTKNILGQSALMFVGAIEVSDFLDFIVKPEDLSEFLDGLLDFLDNNPNIPDWEVLDLYNILEDSPSLKALQTLAEQRSWKHQKIQLLPAPYIPLPNNFDTYLSQLDKKQRHEIRRKLRNVENSLADGQWYLVEDAAILQNETQAFIDLMAQDPNKKDFLTDAMQQHLHNTAAAAFENEWLNLSFFTLDGEKAAGYMSFEFNNRLWLYNSGWEWKYRDFSPGWVLLAYLLKWANEHQIAEFDFMRGDEPYKYKFGGIDRFIYRITLTP